MNNNINSEKPVNGLIHIKYIEKLKDKYPNRICFLIDGGSNCKTSFNIIIKEFLPRLKNRQLIGCHIYNNANNNEFNWQYQKNYILDQYLFSFERIIKYPNLFYLQDKKFFHNVIQAYQIANNLSSKIFIFDFYSLKEQNLLIKNIFYGLNYLLTENNNIPTLIMKDSLTRDDKEKGVNNHKGYMWLILFDGTNLKSYNVLEYFWPFIDRKKDFIYALTIINSSFYSDTIKNIFEAKMAKFNLKENINYFYRFEIVENKKYFKFLKEFINFNEDYYFDFVLFYNNPQKYKVKKNFSYEIIMEMKANIGFINKDNIDGLNSEELIDFEEIQRIEREELRKKKLQQNTRLSEEREEVRRFQAMQYALLNEYEEKKLERQDTNTSLLSESKIDNNNNNSLIETINNNHNNNIIILTNNLLQRTQDSKTNNNRYNEDDKLILRNKSKITLSNKNIKNSNTIISKNNKYNTPNKIYIQAKNSEQLSKSSNYKNLFSKSNKNLNKLDNNMNNIIQKNIRPMNLKEKINIYAKNKNKKV